MATIDPLVPYVRFYLGTVADLDGVGGALSAIEGETMEALVPYTEWVAEVGAELPKRQERRPDTASLWRPSDAKDLTGLTDLYEVVGRFSFQGERNANLDRVASLVTALRAEVMRQRNSLSTLSEIAGRGHAFALERERAESSQNRAQQESLLARFEPEAQKLKATATKLADEIRNTKRPDLAALDTANDQYRAYVGRVNELYTRTLPLLRAQLEKMSEVAECEVPPSWPATLPFANELPEDLVAAPPPETQQLAEARHEAEQTLAVETQLKASLDELGVQLRRVEGEIAALTARESELVKDAGVARLVVRWAHEQETLAIIQRELEHVRSEGTARTATISSLQSELTRGQEALSTRQAEATALAQSLPAKRAALEQHRKDEPALLGKSEWRQKLHTLDDDVEETEGAVAQLQAAIVAVRGEIDRVRAREAQEQAQVAALLKRLEDARGREAQTMSVIGEVEKALGPSRPARVIAPIEAERLLAETNEARNETKTRVERLHAEARRVREDADRATVQLRQIAGRREQSSQRMAAAQKESQQAVTTSLQRLAARRQQGFDAYVSKVLGDLFDSLSQVDRIFVDPARQVMLMKAGAISEAPQRIRQRADALLALARTLVNSQSERFAAQEAVLQRVSDTFVATAPEACRAAWDGV